jgi:MFS family permease
MQKHIAQARIATMVVLFCNGLLYATWGVSVPVIKEKFSLSEGVLAIAMAAIAIGGIVTMAMAGRWISSVGSGSASVRSGVGMALAAASILLIPNYWALLPLLIAYGITAAANDVAANSQGSYLETSARRSLIGSLHACFSVGGLAGSLLASYWVVSGLPLASNFWVLGAMVVVAMAVCSHFLLNEKGSTDEQMAPNMNRTPSENPTARRRLRQFGVLAFSALVVEGAFYDWAAVYMREVIDAPAAWVGFGYAAFAVGMTLGRLAGDKVRDALSHETVMTASGAICILGLAVVLVGSSPTVVLVGFWVTGVGLSNFIPMLFSAAGKLSQNAGIPASQGLAITTRLAYVGLLVGPLFVGPIAQVVGLRYSLITLAAAVATTCLGWLYISRATGGVPWAVRPTSDESEPYRMIGKA